MYSDLNRHSVAMVGDLGDRVYHSKTRFDCRWL